MMKYNWNQDKQIQEKQPNPESLFHIIRSKNMEGKNNDLMEMDNKAVNGIIDEVKRITQVKK